MQRPHEIGPTHQLQARSGTERGRIALNLREYAAQQQGNETPTKGPAGAATPIPYRAIYRAVFDFHARHSTPPRTLEEWHDLNTDIAQVSTSCGNTPFVMDLLAAVYDEIERNAHSTTQANT